VDSEINHEAGNISGPKKMLKVVSIPSLWQYLENFEFQIADPL
jgi:hypothetical protein